MNKAAQSLGRLGGKAKSAAKSAAAKQNGRKGGRPKKYKSESEELWANPKVRAAIRRAKAGKGKYYPLSSLDEPAA